MSELDDLTEGEEVEQVETEAQAEEQTTGEESAPPAPPEPEPKTVPVAALLDERSKRQALEARLAELEARDAPKLDLFEDPDAVLENLKREVMSHADQRWINASRAMVMAAKPDYAEREAAFIEMARENPSLSAEMMRSDNPALFAYETARKHAEYQQMQDIDAYKAKIRAELEAEMAAKNGVAPKPSLATATSATGGDLPSDDDLDSIVLGN